MGTVGAAHAEPRGHLGEVGEHVDERTHLAEIGDRLDGQEVRLGFHDHLKPLAVEVDEPVVAYAVATAILAAVVEDRAVGADTRRDECRTAGGRRARYIDCRTQGIIRLSCRASRGDESLARHLVARGDHDARARVDVGLVHRANLLRLVRQDSRGPQGISEVVAALLEFGGETAVDGQDTAAEEILDGARIDGAQM